MDAVTTAIVAAVLTGAHRGADIAASETVEGDANPVNRSYQALKEALVERFDGAPTLMQAIRQLEGMDSARNRQMLHQEVKIARADQARNVVIAADALIYEIQQQPEGKKLLIQARTWEKFS
jgi:hypothetical protein